MVCGQVYSSPTRDAIYSTIVACESPNVLLIVKNYTGDKINFGLAAEMARTTVGKNVDILIVADDVALLDSDLKIGARGIAGVVFAHKIVGAAAERGWTLERVKQIGNTVSQSVKTFGVALSSCTLPSSKTPMFEMQSGHMEIGLGIHGEKGHGSTPKLSADEIVAVLLTTLFKHIPAPSTNVPIAILLNNLGSTTAMEMAILARAIFTQTRTKGYTIARFYQGTCLTAMETAGISISILPLENNEMLELLDDPTTMPAWLALGDGKLNIEDSIIDETHLVTAQALHKKEIQEKGEKSPEVCSTIAQLITSTCQMLQEHEEYLTNLDSQVGDGDLGTNLKIAANDILSLLPTWSTTHPATLLTQLAFQLDQSLGGTSGPLYSIFFLQMAQTISNASLSRQSWVDAANAGAKGITALGGAVAGDRTMMDALLPAIQALQNGTIENAASAASEGCKSTAHMLPKKGRSSYLQQRALGIVDPGSAAVDLIFQQIFKNLK